jgi:prepilin peptidase CpaA
MNLTGAGLTLYLISVLLIAAVSDIRFQKIPNLLTYSAMFIGIAYHTAMNGWAGLLFSLEGLGLGIAVLIVFYLWGGMGAGDVKLMGAVGGLLGPKGVFDAFLFTAIIGGIYSIVILAIHGYLKEIAQRLLMSLKTFIFTKQFVYMTPIENKKKPKLCYGVAIAIGTIFSVSKRFI